MKSSNKSKRKDVNIIIEPGAKKMLSDFFGCNENQATAILVHYVERKKRDNGSCKI